MSDNPAPVEAAGPVVQPCARHPNIETALTCNRCNAPICPRCMVQTPVGNRCPDCAQLRRLPVFDVRPQDYARATGAALAVAVGFGLLWAVLPIPRGATLLLALFVGVAGGEAVSRAANRKRSPGLKAIAAASVVLAYWLSVWFPFVERLAAMAASPQGLPVALEAVVRLAFTSMASPWVLLGLAFGAYVAATRIDR